MCRPPWLHDNQHPFSLARDASAPSDASAPADDASSRDAAPADPGSQIAAPALSATASAELNKLNGELKAIDKLSTDQLLARHPVPAGPALGYAPRSASNLSLIQASTLALDAAELSKLDTQGFVTSKRQAFPNMAYGYRTHLRARPACVHLARLDPQLCPPVLRQHPDECGALLLDQGAEHLFALKGQEIAALLPAASPTAVNVTKYFTEPA